MLELLSRFTAQGAEIDVITRLFKVLQHNSEYLRSSSIH